MNCYYSNLIEGHDTHPVDIERALKNDYSQNTKQRYLQLEARAHITVQQWIEAGGLEDQAASVAGLREIHRRFCELLPEELLWVENPETGECMEVVPGELRQRDVKVGRHIPVSPGALPRFLQRFEATYCGLGKTDTLFAAAGAHPGLGQRGPPRQNATPPGTDHSGTDAVPGRTCTRRDCGHVRCHATPVKTLC